MTEKHKELDFNSPLADALKVVLDQKQDDPESLKRVHNIVRAAFRQNAESIPYPILNIGKKLMEVVIRDAMGENEYQPLFRQFADDPYRLTKILTKKDPERFFDFFLVAWNLHGMLAEYLKPEEESDFEDFKTSDDDKKETGKKIDKSGSSDSASEPEIAKKLIDRIKENIKFLDEEDIFELAIPLFKQLGDKDKDGFQKGYETLLEILEGIDDAEDIAKVERVFDRFSELIDMQFGQFRPHLKRKNFPYITVRRAIKEMEKGHKDGGRRLAHFDTRTGKTSLALLEPEYLGKKRSLYICPPDTIPTILREYSLYGGDESKIRVVRNEEDFKNLIKENGNIRYCIIPSTLLINIGASSDEIGHEIADEGADIGTLIGDIDKDPDDLQDGNGTGTGIDELRKHVNPLVLQLFESWYPDYIAVDEARHFTGYHCEPNTPSSKRSQALLYLLNNKKTLDRKVAVRLLDATPGDLPRHFYPLISFLHPDRYLMPESARSEMGTKPYVLMSFLAEKTDHASHEQVYSLPPIRNAKGGVQVEMSPAQSVIYEHSAKYSTPNVLHRLTLARLAAFNPVILRPILARITKPLEKEDFMSRFDKAYDDWKIRSEGGETAFDWDFLANLSDRQLFLNLFIFDSKGFEQYYEGQPEKLELLKKLFNSNPILSCKANYVIEKIKEILAREKSGEGNSGRIIVYSSFKRGLTREIDSSDDDRLDLERILAEQIRQAIPEANVYTIDGGVSTQPKKDGFSARDEVRESWKKEEGVNVLLAVGPATCQGVDLSAGDEIIREFYLDIPMDSRLDYQIRSRSIGPNQKRSVIRETLHAVTAGKKEPTIDNGVRDLVAAKHFFRDLVCRRATPVTPEFLEAIENNVSFLGGFCAMERSAEEVVGGTRKDVDNVVKKKGRKKKI